MHLFGALTTVLYVTRFFNFTCSLISNLFKSCLDLLTKMVSVPFQNKHRGFL